MKYDAEMSASVTNLPLPRCSQTTAFPSRDCIGLLDYINTGWRMPPRRSLLRHFTGISNFLLHLSTLSHGWGIDVFEKSWSVWFIGLTAVRSLPYRRKSSHTPGSSSRAEVHDKYDCMHENKCQCISVHSVMAAVCINGDQLSREQPRTYFYKTLLLGAQIITEFYWQPTTLLLLPTIY